MAKFRKNNDFTKRAARKGGEATAAKWATIRREREKQEREPFEKMYFEQFENAENGVFDGFKMIDIFHKHYNKNDARFWAVSDDAATCEGVSVGSDDVICYFFAAPENVKKQVRFNHSVYLF